MKIKQDDEEPRYTDLSSRSLDEPESPTPNENDIITDSKQRRSCSSWSSNPEMELEEAEEAMLSYLRTPYKGRYIDIGPVVGEKDSRIWTIGFNEDSTKTPLVLIHGMGAGIGFWILNLDELSSDRPLYVIDLLGFGRSSRPDFSSDPLEAETQLASSIEAWRAAMNLNKMIVVGHSLGGYLSAAYALRHPENVAHLILADPWGMKEKPSDEVILGRRHLPFYVRLLIRVFEPLNPLWSIRLAGRTMGPKLIQRYRPDIIRNYAEFVVDDPHIKVSNYMYCCNAQKPTGETAFHTLMVKFGWAKNPIIHRLDQMSRSVPMTLLYGKNSWVDHYPIEQVKELRADSYCEGHMIEGAGHHIYADQKETFNNLVLSACSYTDKLIDSGAHL